MSDNIINFPSKKNTEPVEEGMLPKGQEYTFFTFTNDDGISFNFTTDWLDALNIRDEKLDYLSELTFELQVEAEENPEITEYLTAQIERILRTIRNNKNV